MFKEFVYRVNNDLVNICKCYPRRYQGTIGHYDASLAGAPFTVNGSTELRSKDNIY
jgi:hypothetical protein